MIKPSLDRVVCAVVVVLCLVVLVMAALSQAFDSNTHVIYQGF